VRYSCPVLSRKFATASLQGLFLLVSHVDLMFCHCVLLDENFFCVFDPDNQGLDKWNSAVIS
jgi:hypothetical protein